MPLVRKAMLPSARDHFQSARPDLLRVSTIYLPNITKHNALGKTSTIHAYKLPYAQRTPSVKAVENLSCQLKGEETKTRAVRAGAVNFYRVWRSGG
ncbi:hypothetical protein PZA11_000259 [Diplocarpon coronariae]